MSQTRASEVCNKNSEAEKSGEEKVTVRGVLSGQDFSQVFMKKKLNLNWKIREKAHEDCGTSLSGKENSEVIPTTERKCFKLKKKCRKVINSDSMR